MSLKRPRELKAIMKGEQQFTSQIQRAKSLAVDKSEDREIKKMKMIESLFLKKDKEESHKRMLREKREMRRSLLSGVTVNNVAASSSP